MIGSATTTAVRTQGVTRSRRVYEPTSPPGVGSADRLRKSRQGCELFKRRHESATVFFFSSLCGGVRLGCVWFLTPSGRLEPLGPRGKPSGTAYHRFLWVRRRPSRTRGKLERGSYSKHGQACKARQSFFLWCTIPRNAFDWRVCARSSFDDRTSSFFSEYRPDKQPVKEYRTRRRSTREKNKARRFLRNVA